MGRELQKKKKRSSIPKIKLKPKSKKVNPLGNPIIAANWYFSLLPSPNPSLPLFLYLYQKQNRLTITPRNQNETLTQNYRRLGLTSRLNTATGGIEKPRLTDSNTTTSLNSKKADKLAISNAIPKVFAPTEAVVERDPETGKILRVIHKGGLGKKNLLNDPLNSDSDEENEGEEFTGFEEEGGNSGGIIAQLEQQARSGKAKTERKQSEREKEWCQRLVERWGEDWGKMVRDRRLNPMQQTEMDIKRRVAKWRAGLGAGGPQGE